MLRIPSALLDQVHQHARETWPHECCGFLVGQLGDPRICTAIVRATNQRQDRLHDRYEIDPLEWLRLERRQGAAGQTIIGIYHSHPDHPSQPSEFDREHAHPHMSYLIVETTRDGVLSTRSWTLDPHTRSFDEEALASTG